MKTFKKPNIVLSKCINLAATRYDGGLIKNEFAELLGKFVNYVPVCPEVSVGLPVPRDPIIIVKIKKMYSFSLKAEGYSQKKWKNFQKTFLILLKILMVFYSKANPPVVA